MTAIDGVRLGHAARQTWLFPQRRIGREAGSACTGAGLERYVPGRRVPRAEWSSPNHAVRECFTSPPTRRFCLLNITSSVNQQPGSWNSCQYHSEPLSGKLLVCRCRIQDFFLPGTRCG